MTTKEKIIRAACEIFPAKGFHNTTLQDICEKARANIAAVNYHYGSKDKLYFKVWKRLNEHAEQNLARVKAFPSPEEQLQQFIRVRVTCVLSDDPDRSGFPRLVHKEFGHPSPLHETIMETFMKPKHEWFTRLIAQIAGQPLDEATLQALGYCIHSPLIHLMEVKSRDSGPANFSRIHNNKEQFADTIFTFFLAGLKAARPQPEQPGHAEKMDRE